MKEKITLLLTIASISGLVFHYFNSKEINATSNSNIAKIKNIIKNDEPLINTVNNTDEDYDDKSNIISRNHDKRIDCEKNLTETDELSFSDAFKYYMRCQVEGELFTWKSKEYRLEHKNTLVIEDELPIAKKNVIVDKKNDSSLVSR